jgi:hypothetical protein
MEEIKDIVEEFKDLVYLLFFALVIAILIVIALVLHYLFKVI